MTFSSFYRTAGALTAAFALFATTPASSAETGEVLAVVNGKSLDSTALKQYVERRPERPSTPETLIQEMINLELLVQAAEAQKLDQSDDYTIDMEMTRRSLLAQLAVSEYVKANPITETRMREVYDKEFSADGEEELKARHVLVETQEQGQEVIVALDAGGDFATLAKEHSTGPSGPQGGDLGWFNAEQMVPEFSIAAGALEPGSYTKEPVKTQFGWHVILLEERRRTAPPPFESLQPQITEMLQSMQIREYLEGLRAAATIELKE